MKRQFVVLIYKADNAFYQEGTYVTISCNQVKIGDFGMNTYGEIVPLPYNRSPLIDTAMVPEGTEFPSPTAFGDTHFKKVTQVKDMDSLATYYCDTASYNTAIISCNPAAATPTGCTGITSPASPSLGSTTATITWVNPASVVGVEYVVNTSGSAPLSDGTYIDGATTSLSLTGLTPNTNYIFHVRTICGRGVRNGWQIFPFATTA